MSRKTPVNALRLGSLVALLLSACGQPDAPQCTVAAPVACPTPAPRFADVAPIFERRCASCHTGERSEPWPLDTYSHVADWQDLVRVEIANCTMPPRDSGITLSEEEQETILAWVKCGALE